MSDQSAPQVSIGRGVVAGVAGTAVMTALQKFVEMPITGRGMAGRAGLHGQKAVPAVFAVVYTGDLVLNTALGLCEPSS